MNKKKAHTQAGSQDNPKFKDNSAHNQRLKLLDYLFEHNSITTSEAREKLDIMSPAARIKELRQAGYPVKTVWGSWTSEHGIKHRIGRYVSIVSAEVSAETINHSEVGK